MSTEDDLFQALAVIMLTPATRSYLMSRDPKALEQGDAALRGAKASITSTLEVAHKKALELHALKARLEDLEVELQDLKEEQIHTRQQLTRAQLQRIVAGDLEEERVQAILNLLT